MQRDTAIVQSRSSRAAGTVANIMRLGPVFVDAVQEKCLEPLVTSLREESKNGGPMSMMAGMGAGR